MKGLLLCMISLNAIAAYKCEIECGYIYSERMGRGGYQKIAALVTVKRYSQDINEALKKTNEYCSSAKFKQNVISNTDRFNAFYNYPQSFYRDLTITQINYIDHRNPPFKDTRLKPTTYNSCTEVSNASNCSLQSVDIDRETLQTKNFNNTSLAGCKKRMNQYFEAFKTHPDYYFLMMSFENYVNDEGTYIYKTDKGEALVIDLESPIPGWLL